MLSSDAMYRIPKAMEGLWILRRLSREPGSIDKEESQRMETLGRMTRGVVHDFKNLLAIISGHSQLLLEKTPADGQQHIEAIRRAAAFGAELTNYLLRFGRDGYALPGATCVNDVVQSLATLLPRVMDCKHRVQYISRRAPAGSRGRSDGDTPDHPQPRTQCTGRHAHRRHTFD